MFDLFFSQLDAFLLGAGDDPFTAMWSVFIHGGWILFLWLGLWIARAMWLRSLQEKAAAKKEYIVFRVTVPHTSEQTPKAVENIFSSLAAAHGPPSWTDKWFKGEFQTPISMEIVSIEGSVGYYVHCVKGQRDLIEASIYAQYPDADIDIVEDYTKHAPRHFPDEVYDLWGTEIKPVKSDAFPLKTYVDFQDAVSGEMKDPLAILLENFSRIGPGEQVWYQIVLEPTDQKDARGRAESAINKIKGIEEKVKQSTLEKVLLFPLEFIKSLFGALLGGGGGEKKPEKKESGSKIPNLSPGERAILEAIERKMSKIGFMCKMRIVYLARKEVMKKAKVAQPFIGAIKQVNTFHMQALIPDSKKTGMNGSLWWFKDRRNNHRKNNLIAAYIARSDSTGLPAYFMSSEELATLWHFPILTQVRAPLLRRTQAKKADPPSYIPFGT